MEKKLFFLTIRPGNLLNESDEKTLETISTNDQLFEKSKDATFLIRSQKIDAGLYFNPKAWRIIKDSQSSFLEYVFSNSSNPNLFAIFSSENAPVQTLKNLKELVIAGVQKNVDYFRLKISEYRIVNDIKVLHLEYSANAKGLDFEYTGNYYLANEGYGSVIAYTFANKYEENKKTLDHFINGITKIDKSNVVDVIKVASPPPPPPAKATK